MPISTIKLNSNLTGECLELRTSAERSGLIDCSVTLRARIWDGDDNQFAVLSADKLVLSGSRVLQLKGDLDDWIASPHVGTEAFTGEYRLAADRYSMLDLIFRRRQGIIASNDKPVVTIRFKVGRAEGEFCFVSDQSCLRLFANELAEAITNQ